MFRTLVFHEVRPQKELNGRQRPIAVSDGYEDSLPLPLFDSLPLFEEQINYLKDAGYHSLSIGEVQGFYEKKLLLPEKSVLLTFDDCYQSMKEYAYPVLKKAGWKAAAFVVSGWLFDEPSAYDPNSSRVLSTAELEEMRDVFEYVNHTSHFHRRKGTTMSSAMWETTEDFKQDLYDCNQFVDIKDAFAYPFGLYDQRTIDTLKEMSFKLAFTTKPGVNTKDTHPLELHRDVIPYSLSIEQFKNLMEEV
ncbi:polysaccharide deacetylase family protein [Enterococcus sp. CWB-B31]|uniref:polysaccharide deacetylase family protein n=1 Tax=Enterococcus sp. CWB-B31 TaxID=2885159 RepID=UPI001E51847F|nr:polysaccharide deacetylase family protein [Enterococcus sp. CWB-B31]MCB5953464.1 polysaccharide deacetylase family protein [Enterococcus sp. CWB-B31]